MSRHTDSCLSARNAVIELRHAIRYEPELPHGMEDVLYDVIEDAASSARAAATDAICAG